MLGLSKVGRDASDVSCKWQATRAGTGARQGTSMPHFKVKRGSASVSELTTFHMKYIGVKFLRFVSILQILFIYEYESHPFDTQRKIRRNSANSG